MANAQLNKNVFKWRLKAYKLSQLRMSAGMLFQIKTDECLKARDAITVRDKVKSGLSRGRALGPQVASALGANMPSGPCKVR